MERNCDKGFLQFVRVLVDGFDEPECLASFRDTVSLPVRSVKSVRDNASLTFPNFFGDDFEAVADDGLVHGVGNADALVAVAPVGVLMAEEEMVAGDDEDLALF